MVAKEKNITACFISPWYPSEVHSTLGNFVEKHARAVARFCNVGVIHVCEDPKLNKKHKITISSDKQITEIIIYVKKNNFPISIFGSFIKYSKFKKYYDTAFKLLMKRHGKPNVIHANILYPGGVYASALAEKYDIPFVVTEHWTGYHSENGTNISARTIKFMKKVALKASFILPVSNHLGNAMKILGITGNYKTVSNVVNTNIFKPCLKTDNSSTKRIIHISTLHEQQKNFKGILKAIKKLSEIRNDFVLHVISDGNFKPYIDYIKVNKLEKFVKFEGIKNTEEVAAELAISDFLILNSKYENFPCVIPEAYACGVPVLSTNVGGISEHLNSECGILIPDNKQDILHEYINEMLDNTHKYNKKIIRAYAEKYFSYENIGLQFIEIYKEAIKINV